MERGQMFCMPPIQPCSADLPPVVVGVQEVLNTSYIHRLQQYCSHIYYKHTNIDPMALTICVKAVTGEIANGFEKTTVESFLPVLPSKYWAEKHYIITPTTIQQDLADKNKTLSPFNRIGICVPHVASNMKTLKQASLTSMLSVSE
ncbi:hypothetical protein BJV82DRAFT_1063 [Fennellomyces sp. T-0311]|nr:hypothetical protein BJV82DRAFT_1063 [Fennellomyces sp. T-0311]